MCTVHDMVCMEFLNVLKWFVMITHLGSLSRCFQATFLFPTCVSYNLCGMSVWYLCATPEDLIFNMCRKYRRRYLLQDLFPVSTRLSPQKCILLGYEVIVLRITANGLPQVIHETWITGKRLFLCAGEGGDGKVVNVLAYRIVSGRFRVKTSPLNGVPKIF